MTARPLFVKLAAFFFAFAAAISAVAVVRALRPARHYAYAPPPPRPFKLSKDLTFEVGLVTLDREHARSYTRFNMHVVRRAGVPEKLWARTLFFSPDDPSGRVWWGGEVELNRPFDEYGDASMTISAPCGWCDNADAPRGGYFARVQISDGREQTPLPWGAEFRDINTAVPVVVHAERASPARRR